MKNDVDVVLLAPPFFRGAGSRNQKASVSLMYQSAWLDRAGISNVVYNADHVQAPPGGNMYLRWRQLFYRFDEWFKPFVDGKSGIYGEVYEQILSFRPKMVVIQSSEGLLPTVDWGNAWVGEHLAKMLKKKGGIHVVGSGLFYSLDRRFDASFDAMLVGEPGKAVVDVFKNRTMGIVKDHFEDVVPSVKNLWPADQNTEQVMASHGCSWGCAFCLATDMQSQTIDINPQIVAADIAQRKEQKVYVGDMIFGLKRPSMEALSKALATVNVNKTFACENRVDTLTPEKCVIMREMGMRTVKIGVESIDPTGLEIMEKKQTPIRIQNAVKMLRAHEIKVVAYLMLGGHMPDEAYNATLAFCRETQFDHYVVNVWSYDGIKEGRDYRYDSHFSMECCRRWGVREETLEKYFELQASTQSPTLGTLVD